MIGRNSPTIELPDCMISKGHAKILYNRLRDKIYTSQDKLIKSQFQSVKGLKNRNFLKSRKKFIEDSPYSKILFTENTRNSNKLKEIYFIILERDLEAKTIGISLTKGNMKGLVSSTMIFVWSEHALIRMLMRSRPHNVEEKLTIDLEKFASTLLHVGYSASLEFVKNPENTEGYFYLPPFENRQTFLALVKDDKEAPVTAVTTKVLTDPKHFREELTFEVTNGKKRR